MISANEAHDATMDALDIDAELCANNIGNAIRVEAEGKHFNMIWTFNSDVDDIDRVLNILENHKYKVAKMPRNEDLITSVEVDYKISW
jgi:hypothetical protein